jgi:hypothetical protein
LVLNARIVRIFERITNYVKFKEDRVLIGILLKTGRLFIDQFTRHSIPFFTSIFKTHSTSVVGVFKDFQASTRMLQVTKENDILYCYISFVLYRLYVRM